MLHILIPALVGDVVLPPLVTLSGLLNSTYKIHLQAQDVLVNGKTVSQLHALVTSAVGAAGTGATDSTAAAGGDGGGGGGGGPISEPKTAEDFEREAELSPELQDLIARATEAVKATDANGKADAARAQPPSIVLTGATGFIGM